MTNHSLRHYIRLIETAMAGGSPPPITEGRDAPLYHQIHAEKAKAVFAADALMARDEPQSLWTNDSSREGYNLVTQPFRKMTNDGGMQALYGTSFTRNKRLDLTKGGGFGRKVLSLEVDQARVAQTNKIVPLNADLSVRNFRAKDANFNDRHNARPGREKDVFAEEFVLGDLKPLSRYLTRIIILFGQDEISSYKLRQIKATGVFQYAKEHDIPVVWKDGTPYG